MQTGGHSSISCSKTPFQFILIGQNVEIGLSNLIFSALRRLARLGVNIERTFSRNSKQNGATIDVGTAIRLRNDGHLGTSNTNSTLNYSNLDFINVSWSCHRFTLHWHASSHHKQGTQQSAVCTVTQNLKLRVRVRISANSTN